MEDQQPHHLHKTRTKSPHSSRPSASHSRQPSYEISKPLPLAPATTSQSHIATKPQATTTSTRTTRAPHANTNERPQLPPTTAPRTSRRVPQAHSRNASEGSQINPSRVPRAASNERPQTSPTTATIRSVTTPQAPVRGVSERSQPKPPPSSRRTTTERPKLPLPSPNDASVKAPQPSTRSRNERSQANISHVPGTATNERPQMAPTDSTRTPTKTPHVVRGIGERPPTSPTHPSRAPARTPTRTPTRTPPAPPAPQVPLPAAPSSSKEPRSPRELESRKKDLEARANASHPSDGGVVRFLRPLSKFSRKSNIPPEVHETSGHPSHEKALEELPSFMPWRPIPGPKVLSPEEEKFRRSMRKRRIRILAISGTIILLLIITIILLVRIVRPRILSAENTISSHASAVLTQDQQRCLNDFRNQAPSDPTSYSCSKCLPAFRDVSQDFFNDAPSIADVDSIQAAKQFCGMKAIFDASSQDGHANLASMGWLRDIKICTWGGVTCDGSGSISTLRLQSPAAPQTIPDDISVLTALSQLEILGDHTSPVGQIKSTLPPSLRNLTLLNTSLAGFESDSLFQQNGTLSKLESLTMDGNPGMGSSLPSSITELPLQSLIVRNQNLTMSMGALFGSFSLANTITTLDLSFNGLSGNVPFIVLSRLKTLDLSFNNFQSLEISFPPGLQSVSFQNNPNLQGNISAALCTSSGLTNCSFQGTGFSAQPNITCGTCRF